MIYIILDSNTIRIGFDRYKEKDIYKHYVVHPAISSLLSIRSDNRYIDEVQIAIPEVVIRELAEHKVYYYSEDIIKLNSLLNKFGMESVEKVDDDRYREIVINQAFNYYN